MIQSDCMKQFDSLGLAQSQSSTPHPPTSRPAVRIIRGKLGSGLDRLTFCDWPRKGGGEDAVEGKGGSVSKF